MDQNRRKFIRGGLLAAGALTLESVFKPSYGNEFNELYRKFSCLTVPESAMDEDFWGWVASQYSIDPNLINLNNGGVNPQPKPVQEMFNHYNKLSNEAPSYYMWNVLNAGREPLRKELAELAGCSPEEIAVNRNSTEALEIVIFGLNLKAGDEVVLCKQDYPAMINAWKQRERREGIKLVWVSLDLPSEDDDYMVKTFTDAFTDKTKVVGLLHMINWTGQILPVRKIADEAHRRNIDVIIDGAQTFAHIEFKIPDLGGDYFGTSLHKWLGAPFGTGLLYVRKDKIKDIWPLFAADVSQAENIRKFENLGTRSFPAEMAIGEALKFHHIIGSKRKEERFRYLRNYWMEKVKSIPRVKLHTSFIPKYSCGLGLFSIDGMEISKIHSTLFSSYGIHTTAINIENIHGIRITPNVYTRLHELDLLVKAINEIAKG